MSLFADLPLPGATSLLCAHAHGRSLLTFHREYQAKMTLIHDVGYAPRLHVDHIAATRLRRRTLARVIAHMAPVLHRHGVPRITADAARTERHTGYIAWAHFCEVAAESMPTFHAIVQQLPVPWCRASTLADLFALEHGAALWGEHGTTVRVVFWTQPQSVTWWRLRNYLGNG